MKLFQINCNNYLWTASIYLFCVLDYQNINVIVIIIIQCTFARFWGHHHIKSNSKISYSNNNFVINISYCLRIFEKKKKKSGCLHNNETFTICKLGIYRQKFDFD